MKTHGESRRLPFKVGPMEAEGCPVTPSNGIEIQRYMSCTIPGHKSWNTLTIPGQYWHEHMHAAPSAWQSIPRSQDSTGMNTCMLHSLSEYPKAPRYPDHLHELQGVSCVEVFVTGIKFLDLQKVSLIVSFWSSIAYFSMAWCQLGAGCSWSAAFHSSEVTLIS